MFLHLCILQDKSGLEILLGVTCVGLVVFQNSLRINTFAWYDFLCTFNDVEGELGVMSIDLVKRVTARLVYVRFYLSNIFCLDSTTCRNSVTGE